MAVTLGSATKFTKSISEDIEKYEGVRVPLKAGLLETLFVKQAKCDDLHPNPEDDFSIPTVGPSFRIISDYEENMRQNISNGNEPWNDWEEPVYVEKMYPEGYLLLNGHHRWAAAKKIGLEKIPIKIVNPTHEGDIRRMLKKSTYDRRATMDLDEVVFCGGDDGPSEQALHFPFNIIYKERIKRGVPSLCHFLEMRGYDIWVYTSGYYSANYITGLFKSYHVKIGGVITGSSRSSRFDSAEKRRMEKLIGNKYRITLNLYKDMVLLIRGRAHDFEQADLNPAASEWSLEVEKAVKELDKDEG